MTLASRGTCSTTDAPTNTLGPSAGRSLSGKLWSDVPPLPARLDWLADTLDGERFAAAKLAKLSPPNPQAPGLQPPPPAVKVPAWVAFFGTHLRQQHTPQEFFAPTLAHLANFNCMADMPAAVSRLIKAIRSDEPCVVFCDYDADGVFAAAVLLKFLRALGCTQTSFYSPNRLTEGYGPNAAAFAQLSRRASLILTVDCGIMAYDVIAQAKQQYNVDTIVIDHHEPPAQLPPAVACLDPKRADCPYPHKGMCAAGVTFALVTAVRDALQAQGFFAQRAAPDLTAWLDFVALATLADVVPMDDMANRVFVSLGMARLRAGLQADWVSSGPPLCAGLRALCAAQGMTALKLNANNAAFKLTPLINAMGRLGNVLPALEMLLSDDTAQIATWIGTLQNCNAERGRLQQSVLDAAEAQIAQQGLATAAWLLVQDSTWHPGVLGLVAGKLAQKYHRPALVIGENGSGSARSVAGFDIHTPLMALYAQGYLHKCGGHKAAVGLTLHAADKPELSDMRQALHRHAAALRHKPPYLFVETVMFCLPPAHLHNRALQEEFCPWLTLLGPFGEAYRQPLFRTDNLSIATKTCVGAAVEGRPKQHLKLKLHSAQPDELLVAIGFNLGYLHDAIDTDRRWSLLYTPDMNYFMGLPWPQLILHDLRPTTPS